MHLQCKFCSKVFSSGSNLERHIRLHTHSKPYKCSQCEECFSRRDTLKIHEQQRHSGTKQCESRNSSNKQKSSSQNCVVNRRENDEKKIIHKYKKSNNWLKNLGVLQKHLLAERKHKCGECGKRFKEQSGLRRHEISHSGERPYSCEICGNRYPYKHSLIRHFKTHPVNIQKSRQTDLEKSGKSTCIFCSQIVVDRWFETHLQVHIGELQF